jgi:hypothetical protein
MVRSLVHRLEELLGSMVRLKEGLMGRSLGWLSDGV